MKVGKRGVFHGLKIFLPPSLMSAICRMGWKVNPYYAGMCFMCGNHAEVAQMVERPSSNVKVSCSIPGWVAFSHCWFFKKSYSALLKFSL